MEGDSEEHRHGAEGIEIVAAGIGGGAHGFHSRVGAIPEWTVSNVNSGALKRDRSGNGRIVAAPLRDRLPTLIEGLLIEVGTGSGTGGFRWAVAPIPPRRSPGCGMSLRRGKPQRAQQASTSPPARKTEVAPCERREHDGGPTLDRLKVGERKRHDDHVATYRCRDA